MHNTRKAPVNQTLLFHHCFLLLFEEQAASPAMSRHSTDVISKAVQYLNPGQAPVMACDQPLVDITKQIQWISPNRYEEDLYVMYVHIEITTWKALGKWLDSSGLTAALVQADIATPGKADSFLKASHVIRTRHEHQVTAAALYTLLQKAYSSYVEENNDHASNFDECRQLKEDENPQFKSRSLTL